VSRGGLRVILDPPSQPSLDRKVAYISFEELEGESESEQCKR